MRLFQLAEFFSIIGESIRDRVFTTPIKRRVLILEVLRRSRAGTAKKNCDTQLDATKRKNGNKTENWQ